MPRFYGPFPSFFPPCEALRHPDGPTDIRARRIDRAAIANVTDQVAKCAAFLAVQHAAVSQTRVENYGEAPRATGCQIQPARYLRT